MKFNVQAIVKALVGLLVFISAVGYSFYSHADNSFDTRVYSINVHASNAADALNALAFQTGAVMLFPYREAKTRQANSVVGDYTIQEAITLMLKDSGLSGSLTSDGAIKISDSRSQHLNKSDGGRVMNSKKNLLASTIAFFVGAGGVQGVAAQDASDAGASSNNRLLEEVIVTAQKREQRLIDVPISIVAVGEDIIREAGIQNMNDLSYAVPNLSIVETSSGQKTITMRGLGNSLGSSPTVGIYLDEMPLSINTSITVDLQTIDLQRLEVLRGPQGTLYGQGSIGGTIRYITKLPSFDGFEGEIGASAYSTTGGDLSEEITAIANIPIFDEKLAFRMAATYKDKGGWIDQPNLDNANDNELTNIRIKGLWQIFDGFTANAMIAQYKNDAGGTNVTNVGSVTDSNYRVVPVNGADLATTDFTNEYDLYNLTLNYDLGFATLTSSSSKFDTETKTSSQSIFLEFSFGGFDLLSTDDTTQADGFSQEVRLAGNNSALDWVVGALYSDVETSVVVDSLGFYIDGAPVFPPFASREFRTNESTAFFGDISYHLNDQLTIALGTRYFEDERTFRSPPSGAQNATFDKLSSKFSISYGLTDDTNIYLSISEGFRSGGFNKGTAILFSPESVISYELGAKASLLEGRLRAEAAIFHSEYSDYQSDAFNPQIGIGQTQNPGDAEIKGVEWSTQLFVSEGLSLGFNGNITDAEFTSLSPFVSIYKVGDPVNFVPEYSYSLNANFDFRWAESVAGFARVDYNRQGPNSITSRGSNFLTEAYKSSDIAFINAQIGAEWEKFTIKLVGKNLNNELMESGASFHDLYSQNRPRSLGLDVNYVF